MHSRESLEIESRPGKGAQRVAELIGYSTREPQREVDHQGHMDRRQEPRQPWPEPVRRNAPEHVPVEHLKGEDEAKDEEKNHAKALIGDDRKSSSA